MLLIKDLSVGDRVEITGRSSQFCRAMRIGLTGTIAIIIKGQSVGVVWDENMTGHTLYYRGVHYAEDGCGWWVYPDDLQFIRLLDYSDVEVEVNDFL